MDHQGAFEVVTAADELYDLDVDTDRIRRFAADAREHYRQLLERLESQERTHEWDKAYM